MKYLYLTAGIFVGLGVAFYLMGSPQVRLGGTLVPVNQINTQIDRPATSTSMSFNWATSSAQTEYRIGFSATTITLFNATTSTYAGSRRMIWICNPGGTAGALSWVGVEWVGSAPTQTTTANKCDVYSFDVTAATSTDASLTYKVAGTQGAGFQ